MSLLLRAVTYRLYARGDHPGRMLAIRAGLSVILLFMIGAALYHGTASFWPSLGVVSTAYGMVVVFLACNVLGSVIAIVLGGQYKSSVTRLDMLAYLPLPERTMQCLRLYAGLPVLAVAMGITIPVALRMAPDLGWWRVAGTCTVSLVLVLIEQTLGLLRARHLVMLQLSAILQAIVSAVLLHMAVAHMTYAWISVSTGAALLIVTLLAAIAWMWWHPSYSRTLENARRVHQDRGISLMYALPLRALRRRRYLGANGLVIGVIVGLALFARHSPASMPYGLVGAIGVLFAGTLAQESRCLSSRRYPIESVLYGLIGEWLASLWITVYVNTILVVGVLLLLAEVLFGGRLGASELYVGCMGIAAASAGLVASAIIVPEYDDLIAELGTTSLYGIGIWGVFHLYASLSSPSAIVLVCVTFSCVVGAIFCSYAFEKVRWLKTIRRKRYAAVF